MSKYQYLPIDQAKPGDVVEYNNKDYRGSFTHGKLYIVRHNTNNMVGVTSDDYGDTNGHDKDYWRLIKTKLAIDVQLGDQVVCIDSNVSVHCTAPIVYTVTNRGIIEPNDYHLDNLAHIRFDQRDGFRLLCKAQPKLLHQKWKDLYDGGIELEWLAPTAARTHWSPIGPIGTTSSEFNHPNYTYRRKEHLMQIAEDYVIDVKNTAQAGTNQLKEPIMNNVKQEVTEAIQSIICDRSAKVAKKATIKTDLQRAKKVTLIAAYYTAEGVHHHTEYLSGKSKKVLRQAKDVLRTPSARGWTVITATPSKSFREKITLEEV